MPRLEVRQVQNREEIDRIFDLLGSVFPEDRSFFQKRLDYDAAYDPETTWIALADGELAASVQLFPYRIHIGAAELLVGGIGSVAADPAYRGLGAVQAILAEMSLWMRSRGYDLSLLFTGIHPFYEKAGWETVEAPLYVLNAESVFMEDSGGTPYRISKFESGDLDEVMEICERYNRKNANTRVRTREYWEGLLKWTEGITECFWVARKGSEIVAYAIGGKEHAGKLGLLDCAYLDGEGEAVKPLLSMLAAGESVKQLEATIPEDGVLPETLRQLGSVQTDDNSETMWKVMGFPAMLAKLAPELTNRIAALTGEELSALPERLLLRCGSERAVLVLEPSSVTVQASPWGLVYDEEIKCTSAEFCAMLTQGIQAVKREALRNHAALQALFPGQRYAMWITERY
ncbi:GNAT family N-acetyltransferase [Paenibacillus rhizophilus]|uniref:GNAT family N-acetyltransferase n=1 Tax=Paenibacillus rhizophilus TaxID=1850366 RepID=A0A3N9P9K9_9BACL|nr:GNAT family N-acetyltransferase [Paenibacillus rhizophilus]RQW12509.1 GNAT family N-acetyltransferase [Paenibacillus rhizophilus]